MKLKLIKRRDATEKDPITVMLEHQGVKKFFTCPIGGTIEVDEEVGYKILGDDRFLGLFEVVGNKSMSKEYANKSVI